MVSCGVGTDDGAIASLAMLAGLREDGGGGIAGYSALSPYNKSRQGRRQWYFNIASCVSLTCGMVVVTGGANSRAFTGILSHARLLEQL